MEKIKDFLNDYNKEVIIGIILVIIAISQGYFFFRLNNLKEKPEEKEILTLNEQKEEIKETEVTINKVKVEIKGEVKKPGVYELEETKRVIDVINIAQGLTKNASTKVNNLSKKIFDEMVIVVYSNTEIKDFTKIKEEEKKQVEACIVQEVKNDSCNINPKENVKEDDKKESSLVSINLGTKEQLMTLTGIGESKALAIITYRTENGLFTKLEDLKNVSGIGDSTYEQIKNFITL